MTRGSSTRTKATTASSTGTAAGDQPTSETTPAACELVNPGTSGVVYDEAGHSVGGGSRVTLDGDPDPVAMRQLEAGHLLAQRGDRWLAIRDGQLVDPNAEADQPADAGREPRSNGGGTAE